jgi:hypothetical protein
LRLADVERASVDQQHLLSAASTTTIFLRLASPITPVPVCISLSRAWASYAGAVTDKEHEMARPSLLCRAEAGRLAVDKAVAALKKLDPQAIPPYMVPKLLETDAAVSAAALAAWRELDAKERPDEDPWERIAAELDPATRPGRVAPR